MRDIEELLDRAAGAPPAMSGTHYATLAQTGSRRRGRRRLGVGLALSAVLVSGVAVASGLPMGLEVVGASASGEIVDRLDFEPVDAAPIGPRRAPIVVSSDTAVLVLGGVDPATGAVLSDGALLDVATRTWRTVPPAPGGLSATHESSAPASTTDVGLLRAMDTSTAAVADDRAVHVLDLATRTWRPVTAPALPATEEVVVADGFVVLRGAAVEGPVLNVLDLADDSWQRYELSAVQLASPMVVHNGRVLVIGTMFVEGRSVQGTAGWLDLTSGTRTALPDPPVGTAFDGQIAVRDDGTIVLVAQPAPDRNWPRAGDFVAVPPHGGDDGATPVESFAAESCNAIGICTGTSGAVADSGDPIARTPRTGPMVTMLAPDAVAWQTVTLPDPYRHWVDGAWLVDGLLWFGYHPFGVLLDPLTKHDRSTLAADPRDPLTGLVVAGHIVVVPSAWGPGAPPDEPVTGPGSIIIGGTRLVAEDGTGPPSSTRGTAPHARSGSAAVAVGPYLLTWGGHDADGVWHTDGWLLRVVEP
jgi:hypothetical protein